MPRVYKPDPLGRSYKKYSAELLEQAVQEYNDGNGSLTTIAQKYEIKRSVLYRHSMRYMKSQGGQTVLSKESELDVIKYVNLCAEWGYPLESYDLRLLIKRYLDKLGVTEKRFKHNMPGPDFVQSFLKRHSDQISQRVSQTVQRNRAVVTPDILKDYFEHLKKSICDIPVENIVNYDETNLADDPSLNNIIAKRSKKYPERVVNHSKEYASIMLACTVAGEMLPPYVVYKSQKLLDTSTKLGPKGALYNTTPCGWFDANIFDDWVTTMIIPYFEKKPGKKCLIGDTLSSHLSIELIKKCLEKDIHFIFIPAKSIHITQPLDVAFFKPMKMAWRDIVLNWKKTDGRNQSSITGDCFPKLLSSLMKNLKETGPKNITAGFRKTGVHPFGPLEVLKRLPNWNNNIKGAEVVDNNDIFKDMRLRASNIVKPTRKRKLKIEAGRSVLCSLDDEYICSDPKSVSNASISMVEIKNNEQCKQSFNKFGRGVEKKLKHVHENTYNENKPPIDQNEPDQIAENSSNNFDTSPYNINIPAVIFDDDVEGIGQIETEIRNNENLFENIHEINEKNSNMQIISEIFVSDVGLKII